MFKDFYLLIKYFRWVNHQLERAGVQTRKTGFLKYSQLTFSTSFLYFQHYFDLNFCSFIPLFNNHFYFIFYSISNKT